MEYISASAQDLMERSVVSAHNYLDHATRIINTHFGEGYAEKHPEIVAAFMNTAARDYAATIITSGLQDIASALRQPR